MAQRADRSDPRLVTARVNQSESRTKGTQRRSAELISEFTDSIPTNKRILSNVNRLVALVLTRYPQMSNEYFEINVVLWL
ncbi:hypothetical protein J6590_082938 [Homalodisca vitripennis]|nr:hypothetical protein J6590_082938 [Homalodisca vitripennis]